MVFIWNFGKKYYSITKLNFRISQVLQNRSRIACIKMLLAWVHKTPYPQTSNCNGFFYHLGSGRWYMSQTLLGSIKWRIQILYYKKRKRMKLMVSSNIELTFKIRHTNLFFSSSYRDLKHSMWLWREKSFKAGGKCTGQFSGILHQSSWFCFSSYIVHGLARIFSLWINWLALDSWWWN